MPITHDLLALAITFFWTGIGFVFLYQYAIREDLHGLWSGSGTIWLLILGVVEIVGGLMWFSVGVFSPPVGSEGPLPLASILGSMFDGSMFFLLLVCLCGLLLSCQLILLPLQTVERFQKTGYKVPSQLLVDKQRTRIAGTLLLVLCLVIIGLVWEGWRATAS